MPNNLTKLLNLRESYGVGNMEIADLSGYSHDHINALMSGRHKKINNRALLTIKNALEAKYGKKNP